MQNGNIVQVKHIFKKYCVIFILGINYKIFQPLYDYPESSKILNVFEIKLSDEEVLEEYCANELICKGVLVSLNNKCIFFPFIHLR